MKDTFKFRVYADGTVINQDLFEEYDNIQVGYTDDHKEYELPECLIDYIVECCKVGPVNVHPKQ